MSAVAATTTASGLTVDGLDVRHGEFEAVRDASLQIEGGKTLALVGESGSGKSTLAHAIARLLPTGSEIASGRVTIGEVEMSELEGGDLRSARGRVVAYLAQDSMAALNPVLPVGLQIGEVFTARDGDGRGDARDRAIELLEALGVHDVKWVAARYPHELSGGMRQRVMIAIALALRPALLVADEPTTALDVTVQAEILGLVRELQADHGVTLLWITHDMGVVAELADTVAVMYGGRIMEAGSAEEVFEHPAHPYTQGLMEIQREGRNAAPKSEFRTIAGTPPLGSVPSGCPFHPRCPKAEQQCTDRVPTDHVLGPSWRARCHLVEAAS